MNPRTRRLRRIRRSMRFSNFVRRLDRATVRRDRRLQRAAAELRAATARARVMLGEVSCSGTRRIVYADSFARTVEDLTCPGCIDCRRTAG